VKPENALAANYRQLEQCVAATYGLGVDRHGYLRRLIDWNYPLPPASSAIFAQHLYEKCGLSDVKKLSKDEVCEIFGYFADKYGLSLRAQEQCFTELNLIYRAHADNQRRPGPEAALMCVLKSHDPEEYKRFANTEMRYDELLKLAGYPSLRGDEKTIETYMVQRAMTWILITQLVGNREVDDIARVDRNGKARYMDLPPLEKEAFDRAINWSKRIRFDFNIDGNLANWVDQCFRLKAPMRELLR
jgi:hypothetical protein